MKRAHRNRGFTLIELLVVIAIIGILASVVLASLNQARTKSRDAARIAQAKEISKALELYYSEYGYYPQIAHGRGYESTCGTPGQNWGHCDRLKALTDALSPFIKIAPESLSEATNGNFNYSYASQAGDNWGSYGLMVFLETDAGANDGGYFPNAFEVGSNPAYCRSKYTGQNADWLDKALDFSRRCYGGN